MGMKHTTKYKRKQPQTRVPEVGVRGLGLVSPSPHVAMDKSFNDHNPSLLLWLKLGRSGLND